MLLFSGASKETGRTKPLRYAIRDSNGTIVNLIEVEPGDITSGKWVPPTGHSAFPARTSAGDELGFGDKADQSGLLVSRKPEPPAPVALPQATILVYGDDENVAQDQFDVGDTVNIKVTLPASVTDRTIAVPVDRLDAKGNVVQAAALWLKLVVTNGSGTIAKVFSTPGRYGVSEDTSEEFEVPNTEITVFA